MKKLIKHILILLLIWAVAWLILCYAMWDYYNPVGWILLIPEVLPSERVGFSFVFIALNVMIYIGFVHES